jgi:transposase
LTGEQCKRLLEHFVAGTPARTAAELVRVNRNTARLFYHRMRELIARQLKQDSPLQGEVEVDEACLGGDTGGESDHAPSPKVPVFALIRRGDKVFTAMVPEPHRESLPAAPKAKVRPDSIVYSETPGVYNVLDVSDFHHQRVQRRARLARGRAHISSTENFWNQAKRHLRRYNGVPRRNFHLFLKECEWRFNYGSPKQLMRILKYWIRTGMN